MSVPAPDGAGPGPHRPGPPAPGRPRKGLGLRWTGAVQSYRLTHRLVHHETPQV